MNTPFLTPDAQRNRARLKVWWILWGAIFGSMVGFYFVFAHGKALPKDLSQQQQLLALIALAPLVISVVIRWLVLPRITDIRRAFVLFILGLAMAEGCCIFGLFLGGALRDELFLIGLFGIAQYIPIFTRAYIEPKGSGFIPNN
jgi:hypothetical protein